MAEADGNNNGLHNRLNKYRNAKTIEELDRALALAQGTPAGIHILDAAERRREIQSTIGECKLFILF